MKAMRTAPVAKLVVVIDDDPLVLEATGGLLRSWGCCVVAGKSCDEAVVRLAETEAGRRPDLIVCDYQLSRGLTGVEAIERLRGTFGKIPALLISADASSPSREVGPRSYQLLYKPVNAERFHAALVDASVLRRAACKEKAPHQAGLRVSDERHSFTRRLVSITAQGVGVGHAHIAGPFHRAGSGVPFIRLGRVCGI